MKNDVNRLNAFGKLNGNAQIVQGNMDSVDGAVQRFHKKYKCFFDVSNLFRSKFIYFENLNII